MPSMQSGRTQWRYSPLKASQGLPDSLCIRRSKRRIVPILAIMQPTTKGEDPMDKADYAIILNAQRGALSIARREARTTLSPSRSALEIERLEAEIRDLIEAMDKAPAHLTSLAAE